MTTSGCATTEAKQTKRVVAAAEIVGEARAQSYAPQLPLECREHMRRVYPKVGDKFRGTQLRWEASANAVDAKIDRCARVHDEWAERALQ